MISLIEHIEYLTMRHDCVVVPGWGAFIAQYDPARYEAVTGVTRRPRRLLSFNSRVEHNDGLLAQSLMRRESMTYDAACRVIADSVKMFKQQFITDGQLSFGRVGYFVRSDDGAATFMPMLDGGNDSCDSYYGLTNVVLRPLGFEDVDESSVMPSRRRAVPRWVRRAGQVAAAVMLLLGLTIVLTTPSPMGEREREYAAVSMPGVNAASRPVFNWDKAEMSLSIAMPTAEEDAPEVRPETRGRFHLVVSSLPSADDYAEYLAAHPDVAPHASLIERTGRYRVIVASSDDVAWLMSRRAALPAAYANAWVCE